MLSEAHLVRRNAFDKKGFFPNSPLRSVCVYIASSFNTTKINASNTKIFYGDKKLF